MSGPIDVLGIDNVFLAVGDLARARDFYLEKLGLSLKFEEPQMGMAAFLLGPDEPGLFIRASALADSPPRSTPRVWLEVADARAAAEELRRRGVEALAEPFEVRTGWTVEIADPWGNVIGLTDYTKAPELGRRLG